MKKIIIDVLKFKAKIKNSKIFSRPNAQKIKPKGETEESDDGHLIVVNDVNSGSTYKGGNYGYAGYKFLMNLAENEPAGVSPSAYVDRKAIYQKFKFVERAYTPEVAKAIKANFKFEGGSANFCSSAANSKKNQQIRNTPIHGKLTILFLKKSIEDLTIIIECLMMSKRT
jgi:hypothetical protein